uniref:Uncharacterized protein n=1 Tax=Romanomermis culicivorax TaxID=13658 RepID=A0A915J5I6_ROMCU
MNLYETSNLLSFLLCKLFVDLSHCGGGDSHYISHFSAINSDNYNQRSDKNSDKLRIKREESNSGERCKRAGVKDSAEICDPTTGGVCKNGTCVSSCLVKNMKKCSCPDYDDNYCYLCCGNAQNTCRPAHEYDIYQPNGELWERTSCSACRHGATEGLSCDDRDLRRVCHNSKCASNVCLHRPEGSYCDAKKTKVCADLECQDLCASIRPELLTCECDLYSDSRCELCCYDPYTKRCENAFKKYSIRSNSKRPIKRSGISCRYGSNCNFRSMCSSAAQFAMINLVITTFACPIFALFFKR